MKFDTGVSFAGEKHISLPIREKKTGRTELHTLCDPHGNWSPWVSDLRTISYTNKKTFRDSVESGRTVAPIRFQVAASTNLFINRVPMTPVFSIITRIVFIFSGLVSRD